ncbi:MAG: ATP-grasp domain-containing protein [Methylococcaceae bacterium]|nr:ATP-grasp domain-containing protein [Methylococcaceae bacterium]
MRKIFILGGSDLQLDLILEAKKMFFYTYVLDINKHCIGAQWCDEFLAIDIADQEQVLAQARALNIDAILTSATEIGNLTACWVGERLGLYSNSYETAVNTSNKKRMKAHFLKHGIPSADYQIIDQVDKLKWAHYPCIVKPYDSSAGRGLSYLDNATQLPLAFSKALHYSRQNQVIIEHYIPGKQYSVETISCAGKHQIITINEEFIRAVPDIIETAHHIPANCTQSLQEKIATLTTNILNAFNIQYGACHIELKVTANHDIYVIELASRTGGMRSEMINLAFGISYSQLLLLSALNCLDKVNKSRHQQVQCYFITDYNSYQEYQKTRQDTSKMLFEPVNIPAVDKHFSADNLIESKGYYYLLTT